MLSKAKRAAGHVEEGLEKVRAKPWAQPLGKALEVSGKIVGAVEGLVPGANIIGGALSFGATLLNPQPTVEDLQKELRDIKLAIQESTTKAALKALETAQQDLEFKIAHPIGEIKMEFAEVKAELDKLFKEVGDSHPRISNELSRLKDTISRTYHLVADNRFKDGIETIDAAYNVFLREGFEGFDAFSFEFKTTATKSLSPHRIKEYLTIIYQEEGLPACQATMDYILVVMGKYLQMLVAHSIFKEEPDRVTDYFEQFNNDFYKVCDVFKKVTNQVFKAGQEVEMLKPVAPVRLIQRASKPDMGVSENERRKLQQFLESHGLQELLATFLKEGVTLDDVLEMTDKDMKDLGIKAYGQRKRLLRVIEDVHASASEEQPGEQVQSEEPRSLPGSRGASAQSLTDTALAEETQRRLHLREAQASSSRQTAVASSPVARVVYEKQGPPNMVELRSSGGAGEWRGSCLGLFQLLPDDVSDDGKGGSQGPVYRQLHDGDNWQMYLYRAGDFWWVSNKVGVEVGRLRAKVANKEDLLPPLREAPRLP